jgi:uncharacterized membrane protein
MAKPHLVLAFFESETAADGAAQALTGWARDNRRVQLEGIGVLAKDEQGEVLTHKLGPRETRKGIGIGAVLGIVGALASGGLTLLGGAALGGASGGVVGSLFHKGLGMSSQDLSNIGRRLDDGEAAVGALVPSRQAGAVSQELEALGGQPKTHGVDPRELSDAAAGIA